jgi:RNA polymerase sigma-70 factor, ECF subfamily
MFVSLVVKDDKLSALLLPGLRQDIRARLEGSPDLEGALQRLWQAAIESWQGVPLAPEVFFPYLAARLDDPADPLGRIHASDLYLACACASGDARALRRFEAEYFGEIRRAAARWGTKMPPLPDLEQVIRQKLFAAGAQGPRIGEYAGAGHLRNWFRVITVRTLIDHARCGPGRQEVPTSESLLCDLAPAALDPEMAYLKARYQAEFRTALEEACRALDARARTLLRYHLNEGLGIDGIAAIHGVHRATAARWLGRAKATFLEDVRARLRAQLRVSEAELVSIMRLIESDLQVRLSQILAREDPPPT